MFRGLGNDIVEIERIQKAIERNPRFRDRVFTEREIEAVKDKKDPYPSFAGRFAAKEAVSKAFGTGVRGFKLTDIEILPDELGKPQVYLSGGLKKEYEGYRVEISISHSREYATAVAILLQNEKDEGEEI